MANMTTYRLGRTVRFQFGDIQDHLNSNCRVVGTGGDETSTLYYGLAALTSPACPSQKPTGETHWQTHWEPTGKRVAFAWVFTAL